MIIKSRKADIQLILFSENFIMFRFNFGQGRQGSYRRGRGNEMRFNDRSRDIQSK